MKVAEILQGCVNEVYAFEVENGGEVPEVRESHRDAPLSTLCVCEIGMFELEVYSGNELVVNLLLPDGNRLWMETGKIEEMAQQLERAAQVIIELAQIEKIAL